MSSLVDKRRQDLLALLYAAVTEPALWLDVLERMRTDLGAEVALQHAWRDVASVDLSLCTNADPAEMQKYQDYYWQHDPWMARLDRMQAGSIAAGHEFLGQAEYLASEFYQDFLRPQGFQWFMTAIDEVPPKGISVVSFLRSPRAGEFMQEDRHYLQQMLPHIRNCLRIQRELNAFHERVACLETALDQLAPGVLMLDALGRVRYANEATEAIVRTCPEIALRGGTLYLRDPTAQAQLSAALGPARSPRDTLAARTPVPIVFRASDGSITLSLIIAPCTLRIPDTLVLMMRPTQTQPDTESFLRAVFGLTPAQAKCARLLAEGLAPAEIGERLAIARTTLRTHLQELFAKTATQRQAALVAALHRALALRELVGDRGTVGSS